MGGIHICGGDNKAYRYGGFYFEIHHYCGPCPLDKNGDPTNKTPSKAFWLMWEKFQNLNEFEKQLIEVE